MLEIYIACLIFGGLLLAVSMIFGGDHGGPDTHAMLEVHPGSETEGLIDNDFSHDSDLVHASHSLSHGHQPVNETAEAVKLFSFRNGIYFLSFFGLSGTLLELAGAAAVISLVSSSVIGLLAAMTGYKFMSYLARSQSGMSFNTRDFIGRNATVTLNLSMGRKGMICVPAGGQSYELVARVAENSIKDSFIKGENVLIIDIDDNVAIVTEYEG